MSVGGELTSYQYDGDDLRVTTSRGDSVVYQLVDRGNVIGQTVVSGEDQQSVSYVRGLGYISRHAGTHTSYYFDNGQGDVVQTRDAAGNAENQYEYDIFGEATLCVEEYENPFRYRGEQYDSETGNIYLRSRYYSPTQGRFLTQDSFAGMQSQPNTLNLYTYCGNDPVNNIDPSGHLYVGAAWEAYVQANKNNPDSVDYELIQGILKSAARAKAEWELADDQGPSYVYRLNELTEKYYQEKLQEDNGQENSGVEKPGKTAGFRPGGSIGGSGGSGPIGGGSGGGGGSSGPSVLDPVEDIMKALELGDVAKAEEMLMKLRKQNLAAFRRFMQTYVKKRGGVNKDMPDNIYQMLLGAWDGPPVYEDEYGVKRRKPTGIREENWYNRYSNYEFGLFDAINWLVQTGGDINFVLQMRDLQDLTYDHNGNQEFDAWKAEDISAKWQAGIIQIFMSAYDAMNTAGIKVNMPSFYIGAVETKPETLLNYYENGVETHKGIYDQVVDYLGGDTSMIAGAYYGEDVSMDDLSKLQDVSWFMHEDRGKPLLWIPYYGTGETADKYFDRISKIAAQVHDCEWGSRPLFDTIIMQPGLFYSPDRDFGEIEALVGKINEWDNEGKPHSTLGLELEYDMSLVTGRDDPGYSLRNYEKKERFFHYLKHIAPLMGSMPIGIYSGGPNEQAYSTPHMNNNKHNTGNHRVQDSWQSFETGNGTPYSQFLFAYKSGNLIYDINEHLFRGKPMSQKLYQFLKEK